MALATLTIDMVARLANIERDLGKVSHQAEQAAHRIDKFVGRIAAMGHAAIAASALKEYAQRVQAFIDAADEMNDMATRTGAAIQSLAALELAANQSGTTLQDVGSGLSKMAVAMVEHGDALKSVGIDAKNSREALYQFADLIKNMPSDAPETIELVRKVLGKSGDGLIPLLKLGSEGLREAEKASADYAAAMAKLAPKADEFNDAVAKLVVSFKGLAADRLLPYMEGMTAFVGLLNDATKGADGLKKALDRLAELTGSNSGLSVFEAMSKAVDAYYLFGGGGDKSKRSVSGKIGGAPSVPDPQSPDAGSLDTARALSCRIDGGTWDAARKECIKKAKGKPEKSDLQKFLDKKQQSEIDDYYRYSGEESMGEAAVKNAELSRQAALRAAEAIERQRKEFVDLIDPLQKYRDMLDQIDKLEALGAEQGGLSAAQALEARWKVNDAMDEQLKQMNRLNDASEKQRDIGRELGMSFSSAFEDAIIGGKKLGDVLQGLAQDIQRIILRKNITEPLANAVASIDWSGVFGVKANALGDVYAGPGISAYSSKVVDRPTVFPFARGVGLMGEAGAEAIMPLARDGRGRLGVRAAGASLEIHVHEAPGTTARIEQHPDGNGGMRADVYIEQIEGSIARRMTTGHSLIGATGERMYGWNRVARGPR